MPRMSVIIILVATAILLGGCRTTDDYTSVLQSLERLTNVISEELERLGTTTEPVKPTEPVDIVQQIIDQADSINNTSHFFVTNQGTPIIESYTELAISNVDAHEFWTGHPDVENVEALYGVPMGGWNEHIEFSIPGTSDSTTNIEVLGGWLDYSYFEIEHTSGLVNLLGTSSVGALSLGSATNKNPISGSAVWNGAAAGYDLRTTSLSNLFMSAGFTARTTLTADLDSASMNILFSDFVLTGIGSEGKQIDDIRFDNLELVNGELIDNSVHITVAGYKREIEGRFYGPNHEEAGGTFVVAPDDDYTSHVVVGAFGAKRANN